MIPVNMRYRNPQRPRGRARNAEEELYGAAPMSSRKVTLSFRVEESFANAIRAEAALLGITLSDLIGRKLGVEPQREPVMKPTQSEALHHQRLGVSAEAVVVESAGEPKLTAKYMYDQYMAETEVPPAFTIAHSAGIIPLSWFVHRHGFPDPSHIDAFEEFLAVDDPSAFGLNELAWEFIEE